jgi:hypothetical protein
MFFTGATHLNKRIIHNSDHNSSHVHSSTQHSHVSFHHTTLIHKPSAGKQGFKTSAGKINDFTKQAK